VVGPGSAWVRAQDGAFSANLSARRQAKQPGGPLDPIWVGG